MKKFNIGEMKKKNDRPGMEAAPVHGEGLTLACWKLERGARLEKHAHPHTQITYIISGRMKFQCGGGEPFAAGAGDFIVFEPNEAHGADVLEDCVTVDAFSPAREDFKRELGWKD